MRMVFLMLAFVSMSAMADDQKAFRKYCSFCHALPDVVQTEPDEKMYLYARVMGAKTDDIEAIRRYIDSLRTGENE